MIAGYIEESATKRRIEIKNWQISAPLLLPSKKHFVITNARIIACFQSQFRVRSHFIRQQLSISFIHIRDFYITRKLLVEIYRYSFIIRTIMRRGAARNQQKRKYIEGRRPVISLTLLQSRRTP